MRRCWYLKRSNDPPGEARQDWQIIMELARRMGNPVKRYQNESEVFNEIAAVTPIMAGISYERIDQEGIQRPCPTNDHPGTSTLFFLDRFNTPSEKAILHPVDYVPQKEETTADYPFLLNTGRILFQFHTSTMSRRNKPLTDFANRSYVLMHPDDMKKLGFVNGEEVKLISRQGEINKSLKISEISVARQTFYAVSLQIVTCK